MTTLVTAIIPCRNEAKNIVRFLDSLAQQECGGIELEVIIADGMSDDGTRDILERYQQRNPRLRILDNPERIVSTGLNRAIRSAKGEIVVRLDVHSEYARDYIQCCVAELSRTGADNVGGPALTRAKGFAARAVASAYHSTFACGGAKFHDPEYEGYVDTVTYGCWRKTLFERVGGFDESLPRNQDDEHNLRLHLAGGKIWQSPRIVSWYYPRSNLVALFLQYLQYGFWKVAVIRKHRRAASWRHLVPAISAVSIVMLMIGGIAGVFGHSAMLSRFFFTPLLLAVGSYTVMSFSATFLVARRCGWDLLPLLPLVFIVYHCSYGLGFILGMIYLRRGSIEKGPWLRLFTTITR